MRVFKPFSMKCVFKKKNGAHMATDRITSQSEPSVHVRNVNEVSARKAGKLVYVVSLSAVSRPVGPDVSRLGVKSEKYATLFFFQQ